MAKFDISLYSKFINIEKTIELFGIPDKRESKLLLLCSCGREYNSSIRFFQSALKRNGCIRCQSCLTSDKWKSPGFREKICKTVTTKEWKLKASQRSQKNWDDPHYRENHKLSVSNPSNRARASKKTSEQWSNSDSREKLISVLTSNNHKEKMSSISRQLWEDDGYKEKQKMVAQSATHRENLSKHTKKYFAIDDNRIQHSLNMKNVMSTPEIKEKVLKNHYGFLKNSKDSIPEKLCQGILTSISVMWEKQYRVGPYVFDLFIPSHNLLIEIQGEYWHSLDRAKKKDAAKFTYVNEYHNDYRLIYIHEKDFLNPGIVKQKLIRELYNNKYEESQVDFLFENVNILFLDSKEKIDGSRYSKSEIFLKSFHYAQFGRSAKLMCGGFINGELISVCKFSTPSRQEVATSLNLKYSEVLELDRFCIHPAYQKKNFASWMVSRCSKLAFEKLPKIRCLVSFADSTMGHSGTIYKASNWEEIGKTKPSYHYLDQSGFPIHKKTLWNHARHMKKTESEYAEEFGYIKVIGKEKTKFILKRTK